jgi:ribosomal protein S18 acetylase RimI-like enzyme
MNVDQSTKEKVEIIELKKGDACLPRLTYRYVTSGYYSLEIQHELDSWKIELSLKPLEKPWERVSESVFFEDFVEEPRAFAAVLGDEQVGWVELGYHKWNNRMRVWEFLVKEEFRGRGIGVLLMEHAVKLAKEKGARMLVLETQSCNVSAIDFYQRFGFELIGFDKAAYSNEDIERKEVRLEFGLRVKA